jgi:hypothetical protein
MTGTALIAIGGNALVLDGSQGQYPASKSVQPCLPNR